MVLRLLFFVLAPVSVLLSLSNSYAVPLEVSGVSMYQCAHHFQGSEDYSETVRVHYFYADGFAPSPVSIGNREVECHDTTRYGDSDGPLFPRMNLKEKAFSLWSQTDVRFLDADLNGVMDIHDQIRTRLEAVHPNTAGQVEWFHELLWTNSPESRMAVPRLGYFLRPWFEPTTLKAFCPTKKNARSGDAVFSILKDLAGDETEAVYLAQREPLPNQKAPEDVILIREAQLKKVWFYMKDGKHVRGSDAVAGKESMMFYWPANTKEPFVKHDDQYVYTVRSLEKIQALGIPVGIDLHTVVSIPTHDKRLGCIPVTK